jgi:hypothetical protein
MTTRQTMFGVALIAVNCAAFSSFSADRPGFLAIGLMPSLNLLAVGGYLAIDRFSRRGEVRPFLVGFEAFGWAATVVFLVAYFGFPDSLHEYQRRATMALEAFWWKYVMITGGFTHNHPDLLRLIFAGIVLSAPQLLVGVLGGWIASQLGVVVQDDRPPEHPEARPISSRRVRLAAIVAGLVSAVLVLGLAIKGRREQYRRLTEHYARSEEIELRRLEAAIGDEGSWSRVPDDWAASYGYDPRAEVARARSNAAIARGYAADYAALKRKYRRAARYPWLPLPPDPALPSLHPARPTTPPLP